MTTVVVSPFNVLGFPEGGGHLWVYMQYVQGLKRAGCDVYWMESLRGRGDRAPEGRTIAAFLAKMERFGLAGKVILHEKRDGEKSGGEAGARAGIEVQERAGIEVGTAAGRADSSPGYRYVGIEPREAEEVFARADLLLNFHYAIDPALLSRFRRTAAVDIDPGLLQHWIATGQLSVPPHDVYFTIGETVGTPTARFPDCGLPWVRIRPPVCLDLWPYVHDPACARFTTVAGWWSGKWVRTIADGKEVLYENTKRASFLEFVDLPRRTPQELELALYLADGDAKDQELLESHGWHVRDSREIGTTPERYRSYVQASRGEISCAKPSCMRFQNAWISDRTVCYLASGKPAVVQDTGPSSFLPSGKGLFRFSTIGAAAEALAAINADYGRHCRAARELAEAQFDARKVIETILNTALSTPS